MQYKIILTALGIAVAFMDWKHVKKTKEREQEEREDDKKYHNKRLLFAALGVIIATLGLFTDFMGWFS